MPSAIELRHDLLRALDRAVGAEAEAAQLRARVGELERTVRSARTRADALARELEAARKEVLAVRGSTTWRIGTAIVAPAARVAKALRRPRR